MGHQFPNGFLLKLSRVREYRMGFWKTEWGYNRVCKESMGLPEKSVGSTFNGAVTGGSEICGEVLWNNALIVSNGETLYNKHFVDKGILTVKNIIDESGQPLRWAEAKQRYVFNLIGLMNRIPRNWKNIL